MLIALIACLAYTVSVWLLYRNIPRQSTLIAAAMGVAFLAHAVQVIHDFNGLMNDVSVMNMLTLVAMCMAAIGAWRYFRHHDRITYTVVALIAAVCVWMPVLWPAPETPVHGWALKVHIVLSIAAYIAIGFAALYACFLLLQDNRLRNGSGGLNLAIPLNEIERTMMRFARFGEALLTLSLATGVLFIRDIWAQHVAHKVVFGLIAWLIIGTLLFRHHYGGFRGRRAALWLLGGFVCLLLAYFGSAFVLQMILQQ
ncbi:MAG: hypothetical protein CR977_03400 [Gammaproteobacteria bacterium]|nr:MAG: hypothetical protein CR977_03400 [Gammaproteobacteria bacterium]